ncbi:hypothetical protein CSAL01_12777 [Colletotrichum salicis]|uniref:Uncharacterized protein n=1 Tax=Colletotrichum salicis TaxID=1209931 RepID=A0A135SNK0_9PEZI|nr:hypothetical protein CSAL01_12777 [Colletotrichum salicis]
MAPMLIIAHTGFLWPDEIVKLEELVSHDNAAKDFTLAICPERLDDSILSPADSVFDLYNIAFSSLSRHCGGIGEIQHVKHLHTVDDHLDKWPLFTLAPVLKRLRLGVSCLKYWEEDWPSYAMHNINTKGIWRNLGRCESLEILRIDCPSEQFRPPLGRDTSWESVRLASSLPSTLRCLSLSGCRAWFFMVGLQRLIERIVSGDLPHFRSLHIIDKVNAMELSSEELVVTTKLEELGVELKFYEQNVRNNMDSAAVEDEGWTLHNNIGGSLEFVVAAKRVSTRGSEPGETQA